MADVPESDTDPCVQKGQPNDGVRRRRAEGLGGDVAHGSFPYSAGVSWTLTRSQWESRGQRGVGWHGYEATPPKDVTEFQISSICEDKEQNILALDQINNWKSDYFSCSMTLRRNSSSGVLPKPRGCAFSLAAVSLPVPCQLRSTHHAAGLTWPT